MRATEELAEPMSIGARIFGGSVVAAAFIIVVDLTLGGRPSGFMARSNGHTDKMDIIRHDDGSLTVPVVPGRHDHDGEGVDTPSETAGPLEETMVLRPGEGGYVEALARWDEQQNPGRGEPVSTASGREQAMHAVHAVAEDGSHATEAVEGLADPEGSGEALRHVLVGGTPSVKAFAEEVAASEGGEPLAPHIATRIIGEVLAEIDAHTD